jgi:hypothetical protein
MSDGMKINEDANELPSCIEETASEVAVPRYNRTRLVDLPFNGES